MSVKPIPITIANELFQEKYDKITSTQVIFIHSDSYAGTLKVRLHECFKEIESIIMSNQDEINQVAELKEKLFEFSAEVPYKIDRFIDGFMAYRSKNKHLFNPFSTSL